MSTGSGFRLVRAGAILVAVTLFLAGCMQLNIGLTINSDDTIDGQILLTAEKSLLTSDGSTVKDGFAKLRQNIPALPAGEETAYEDAKYYGTTIAYHHAPLAAFNTESIKIIRDNDLLRFRLPLDPALYGSKFASPNPQNAQQFMKLMSFQIQVSFPGRVIDTNGTVIGQNVSWQVNANEDKPAELRAVAQAPIPTTLAASPDTDNSSGGVSWLLIAGVVVGVLLIAVVVVLLLRRPAAGGSGR